MNVRYQDTFPVNDVLMLLIKHSDVNVAFV